MTPPAHSKVPEQLHYEADPNRPGHFRVVDSEGAVWAEGVPTVVAAKLLAASPSLLLGYDWLLDEAFRFFQVRWEIDFSGPDLQDFADDDGALEERYPGAPEDARWLQELIRRSRTLRTSEWDSPVERAEEPQLELF